MAVQQSRAEQSSGVGKDREVAGSLDAYQSSSASRERRNMGAWLMIRSALWWWSLGGMKQGQDMPVCGTEGPRVV